MMDRRRFLYGTTAAAVARDVARAAAPLNLEEATLAELGRGMAAGRLTSRAATEWYLARIAAIDEKGPKLGAVIEVNPEALAIADARDGERRSKKVRGPLHGVPILLKDNIDTGDRMQTTAGSLALVGAPAKRDAFVVEKLRAAGAVIIGKTNLSEWANFRSTRSVSGWSGRGGQTKNPYALDRNPCGSSAGSAVAVTANLCAVAVGTETDGSVTCPASVNGIVGIKPTVGLVGRSGIIPISHSQDTAGPMARTVRDAAILLGAMAGVDARDPATRDRKAVDYMKFLDPRGLKGARIGVERKFFGASAESDQAMEAALAEMKRQGAELVDPANLPTHGEFDGAEMEMLLYEFKADLNAYLAERGARVKSLAELIAFNQANAKTEMPWFGQELLERAETRGPLSDGGYRGAREFCVTMARGEGIDAVLAKWRLDAIVAPTAAPAVLIDYVHGDGAWATSSGPAAVAGYPHITVPAGMVHGLPVGISFFGPAWSEGVLLKLAYAFEQGMKARRKPGFAPQADIKTP